MEALPFIIFAVFFVLVIVGAIYGHQRAKQRREALAALAGRHGWRFDPERDRNHHRQFKQHSAFRRGSGRYAYNSLFGELELPEARWPFKAGDYHYETRSTDKDGKSRTSHHHFSYLLVRTPYADVPDLTLRPEHFFDKVSATFGFDDIDFESVEFSKKFHVKSTDKRFAYDVVHARMMEFLLATRGPVLALQDGVCCVTQGGVWKPEQFGERLGWTREFFEKWPRHLVAELESRQASVVSEPFDR